MQTEGIYTNYVDGDPPTGAATGHELLSESAGMWLQYLAEHHQYRPFANSTKQRSRRLVTVGSSAIVMIRAVKGFAVNATLDDLRIIRALNLYDAQKTSHYRQARQALC